MDVHIGRPVKSREEELERGPAAEAIVRRNTGRCAHPDLAPACYFAPKLFFPGERLISCAKAISARQIKVAALTGLMSTILFSLPLEAQSQRRATGLIPAAPEELAKFPKAPRMRAFLPELVDLSKRFPAVGSQGDQGSCVGWAVGYAARSYYTAIEKEKSRPDRFEIASPAYIYDSIRIGDCDDGSQISDALNLLASDGALSLAEYPYDEGRCAKPTREQMSLASGFRIKTWLTLDTKNPDFLKQELANGDPVVLSLRLTDSFDRIKGRHIWNPSPSEATYGNHAVTLTAYNERGQYFKFINSWGQNWGDRGYGRLSYDAVKQRARAAYVMRLSKKAVPVPPPEPQVDPEIADFEIPAVDCGRLTLESRAGGLVLVGYVNTQEDLALVRKAAGQAGIDIDVDQRPWPQCETLMTLDDILTESRKPTIEIEKTEYQAGDTASFAVRMPDYQGYLHVAYVQADGTIVHLSQSAPTSLRTRAPGERTVFGDGQEGRPRFKVTPPFGDEMIVVLASKSPLFDSERPQSEIERDFLTALRKAVLAGPSTSDPARTVSAEVVTLRTKGE